MTKCHLVQGYGGGEHRANGARRGSMLLIGHGSHICATSPKTIIAHKLVIGAPGAHRDGYDPIRAAGRLDPDVFDICDRIPTQGSFQIPGRAKVQAGHMMSIACREQKASQSHQQAEDDDVRISACM